MAKTPLKPAVAPEAPVQPEEQGAPAAGVVAPEPPPAAEPDPATAAAEPALQAEAPEAPEAPTPTPEPVAPVAPGKIRCRVNWRFDGFREEVLVEGDEVETDEAEAAPFLGGVLTRIEEED